MRKLFLSAAIILLTAVCSYAQTINDIPLKDVDLEYIEIVGTAKFLSSKLNIELDFGQENKFWTNKSIN